MKYFTENLNIDEARRHYYRLAMALHPDRGGSTESMQELNSEYERYLISLNGRSFARNDKPGETYTFNFDEVKERELLAKIYQVIAANLQNVDCLLIGSWLWITGETKAIKDQIKVLGFSWHKDRECWFWHSGRWYGRQSRASLAGLAHTYGASKVGLRAKDYGKQLEV